MALGDNFAGINASLKESFTGLSRAIEDSTARAFKPFASELAAQLKELSSSIKSLVQSKPSGIHQTQNVSRFNVGDNVFQRFLPKNRFAMQAAKRILGPRLARSFSSGKLTKGIMRAYGRGGFKGLLRSPYGKIAARGLAGAAGGGAAFGRTGAMVGGSLAVAGGPVTAGLVAGSGLLVGAFNSLGAAVVKSTSYFTSLGRSLVELSPSMAGVFARADFRQRMRSMREGESLAPDMGRLQEAVEDLKDYGNLFTVKLKSIALSWTAWAVEQFRSLVRWSLEVTKSAAGGIAGWLDGVAGMGAVVGTLKDIEQKIDNAINRQKKGDADKSLLNQLVKRLAQGEMNLARARALGP